MAKGKSSKNEINLKKGLKTGKKVYKKVKKSKFKGLIVVLILIVLAALGFLGFTYYKENKAYSTFTTGAKEFLDEINLSSSTDSDISLPQSNEYDVKYEISDQSLMTLEGKVNRPSYSEGDKTVTITVTISYSGETFLYNGLKDKFEPIIKKYVIVIKAKEATKDELIEEVYQALALPLETYTSISLPLTALYDDLSIEWTSNKPSVMSNTGEVLDNSAEEKVQLSAKIKYLDLERTKTFEILVRDKDFSFEEVNDDFDSLDVTSRYNQISSNSITYYGAMISEDADFDPESVDPAETNTLSNNLKLRSTKDEMAFFETDLIESAYSLSFRYKFDSDQKTEKTSFDVYINDELVESITVLHRDEWTDFEFDLSSYQNFKLKVVHQNTFSTDVRVLIDDVLITRGITKEDLENALFVPSSIVRSIYLQPSTKYGGKVEWVSENEDIISSSGLLLRQESDDLNVTLKATVTYLDITFIHTFEIKVKGLNVKDPLEIYFIDLGTTSLSDTGESIYIKYKDIDVLVDAGDNFESTYLGVKDTINAHSEDLVLDYVIATHPDSDHIGNMANVFYDYQVNNLIKFSGESFTTKKFINLKAAYEKEEGCNVIDIYNDIFNGSMSKYIYFNEEIYIEFIDTHYFLADETNGRSIVFLLNVYDTKVLFTGDADNLKNHEDMELGYMDQVGDIDILKVVHHGTANGCDVTYLNYIKPEVAIICNGNYLGNKHGHPHVKAITNLLTYKADIKIYAICGGGLNCALTSTGAYKGETSFEESKVDRNGTIRIVIDNSGYSITSENYGENILDITETTYWKNYLKVR